MPGSMTGDEHVKYGQAADSLIIMPCAASWSAGRRAARCEGT
jgi:hypothetical protein